MLGVVVLAFPLLIGTSVSILLGAVLVVALVHALRAFSVGTLGSVLQLAMLTLLSVNRWGIPGPDDGVTIGHVGSGIAQLAPVAVVYASHARIRDRSFDGGNRA